MIDLTNYARNIELKKFVAIQESMEPIVEEAPAADPMNTILAAKTGTGNQDSIAAWNQLKTDIVNKVNANPPVYTGSVNLTSGGNQVTVNWKVDETTGIVSYTNPATNVTATGSKGSTAQAGQKKSGEKQASPAPKPQPTGNKYEDMARQIIIAAQWGEDWFGGTDDAAMRQTFYKLQNQQDFNELTKYFNQLNLDYNTNFGKASDDANWKKLVADKSYRKPTATSTLAYWIGQELDGGEVEELNALLKSKGITSQFQAL